MVWAAVMWLGNKGRERIERNLSEREQAEFWRLLKKSKGRPGALAERDRTRIKNIAGKALRGA
jgi:hypothetical protein